MYLGDSWVLTAAHCVTTVKGNFLTDRRIRLGTQDISQPGANYRIDRAVVHKDYVPADKLHDIALLHFVQDDGKQARLPPAVRPIRLLGEKRSDRPLASFDRVSVTGWGLTGARSSGARALGTDGSVLRASSALKQVDLAVFPREKCESVAEYRGFVGPGVICAGSIVKGDDSCSGDSGGPMTRAQGDERVLVGLVSWGKGCGLPDMPALYTRVDHYLDWIKAARKKAPPGVVSRL
jgi:secreted trypsin-like serine protease